MKSMGSVDIGIAEEKDDAAIGEFFSRITMQGTVRIAFERRSCFLRTANAGNNFVQVLIGKDHLTGNIVGIGSRAVRRVFVNGEKMEMGYLSSLRLDEKRRGNIFLARGYQYLHELHSDKRVKVYFSTVMEENREALAILTSGRAGLPIYQDIGGIYTCVITVDNKFDPHYGEFEIRQAREGDMPMVYSFLENYGRERQLFPVYTKSLNGLNPHDIVLAFRGDVLIGCAAICDVQKERRIVVHGYSSQFLLMRVFWNVFFAPFGWPVWPDTGTDLQYAFAGLLAIDRAHPLALYPLIGTLKVKARARGLNYLIIGLHEKDPLWPFLKDRYRFIRIKSRLFLVYWDDGKELANKFDSRPPYIDLSTL